MIAVGIDVAKDKHDGFILSLEGEALADVFTIQNNAEGIDALPDSFRYLTPTHTWKREIPDICAMPFFEPSAFLCQSSLLGLTFVSPRKESKNRHVFLIFIIA